MKQIKKLTKANCYKYGIEVASEYDFSDDGNKFRGFIYKGIPMTQCYADDTVYLAVRIDYLPHNFTCKEWMATEEYNLCDEFNGASEIDIDKLIDNLEKIIAKFNEMNANVIISEEDVNDVTAIVMNEVADIESFIEDVKKNFKWWEKESYVVNHVKAYMQSLISKAKNGNRILNEFESFSISTQKEYIERAKAVSNNSVRSILNYEFYITEISKYLY